MTTQIAPKQLKAVVLNGSVSLVNLTGLLTELNIQYQKDCYWIKDILGFTLTDSPLLSDVNNSRFIQPSKINREEVVIDLSTLPDYKGTMIIDLIVGTIVGDINVDVEVLITDDHSKINSISN
jgi:hypothetical protein